jgi:DNA repair protein RecN (Recombination protein N)
MLMHLTIRDFAVVESLHLDFSRGMTVMTGETGAGKSILIDALQLALGERSDASVIRHEAPFAEISAHYDISTLTVASDWLIANDLNTEDECIVRRVINKDGRSKAYINGRGVPLSQLRDLGWYLVNIHGQHQHQLLLKPEHQRTLLDCFAEHEPLLSAVLTAFQALQRLKKEEAELLKQQGQLDKLALLQYQIRELEELNLSDNELAKLEVEQKELAHAEHWLNLCQQAIQCLKNDNNQDALSLLYQGKIPIDQLKAHTPKLNVCHELFNSALIQLDEALAELEQFSETISLDPTRLKSVEERLGTIHHVARKHRIQPENIVDHKNTLNQDINELLACQTHLENISAAIRNTENTYKTAAEQLSDSRKKAALSLEKLITTTLQTLEMPKARFKIEFTSKNISNMSGIGIDDIEYLVSTNPGLDLQPLRKIASGGELSRISLAIQVIMAKRMTTPTLIFDEVDAGISGKTAETVGKLLKKLANEVQVLCVTHLPQIAALGNQHYQVTKNQTDFSTSTDIKPLNEAERIEELARMVGGSAITPHALLHAKALLETA